MMSIKSAAVLFATGLAFGCQAQPQASSQPVAHEDVLDVHPAPAAAPAPIYTPVAAMASAPMPVVMASDTSAAVAPAVASTHVVRRGETMYSIARVSLGDARQWKRIAAANPGINPSGLKVGQALTMP